MKHGSFQNVMIANAKGAQPEVGMGVTQVRWTDRYPFTVIKVNTPRMLTIQADKVVPEPHPSGYAKEISQDPDGQVLTIRHHRDDKWYDNGGTVYTVGKRAYYYDHGF